MVDFRQWQLSLHLVLEASLGVPLDLAYLALVHHKRWPLATWRHPYGRRGLPISAASASAHSLCSWSWRARALPRSWCSPATECSWWNEGISGGIALEGSQAFSTEPRPLSHRGWWRSRQLYTLYLIFVSMWRDWFFQTRFWRRPKELLALAKWLLHPL